MIENAEAAREFLGEGSVAFLAGDRRTMYAIVRSLEIISEASRRVDEEARARHPQLPWRKIADSGNVYRHRYDIVSAEMIWNTVHRLDEIIAMCRAELERPPS